MERNRGQIMAIVAAVVIAVVSLGVAFAAFSATLTINGNATIEASTWDIHFSQTQKTAQGGGTAPASGGVTITPTTESGSAHSTTSLLTSNTFTWAGTFKSPNDTLEYRFYIVNAGDYNASLSAPTVSAPVCKIGGTTQDTCPITYTITKDGTNAFTGSDSLAKGASQLVVVRAQLSSGYGGNGSSLATSDIDVSTSTVTFTYTQTGSAQ